ncbi:MAG TPA: hypothetical protein VFN97_14270 [Actinospica sp.]|nr:hypothetical protein [Actinospica sp.]
MAECFGWALVFVAAALVCACEVVCPTVVWTGTVYVNDGKIGGIVKVRWISGSAAAALAVGASEEALVATTRAAAAAEQAASVAIGARMRRRRGWWGRDTGRGLRIGYGAGPGALKARRPRTCLEAGC